MRRSRAEEPTLITTAPENSDDEFDRRRRKYAIMMSLRALCVLGAALTYHLSLWLALGFVVGGMVLPWCAVLIANDRPAKKRAKTPARPGASSERMITSGRDGRTIDLDV